MCAHGKVERKQLNTHTHTHTAVTHVKFAQQLPNGRLQGRCRGRRADRRGHSPACRICRRCRRPLLCGGQQGRLQAPPQAKAEQNLHSIPHVLSDTAEGHRREVCACRDEVEGKINEIGDIVDFT